MKASLSAVDVSVIERLLGSLLLRLSRWIRSMLSLLGGCIVALVLMLDKSALTSLTVSARSNAPQQQNASNGVVVVPINN